MNESRVLNILRRRRSVRRFHPKPVEPELIDCLIEAALRSPSSRGRNPWEFIVVEDPQILGNLARAKQHGAELIANAPLAIVVAADPSRCDVWIEDCAVAALILHLCAADLGLGSCWVQFRLRKHSEYLESEEFLRSLLHLPKGYAVLCAVAIGYAAESLPGHPYDSLPSDRVHRDRFDSSSDS